MPIERSADHPTFELGETTITSFAAPARGSDETAFYRADLPPGMGLPAHRHDHFDVFLVVAGGATFHLGDETTRTGGRRFAMVPTAFATSSRPGPMGARSSSRCSGERRCSATTASTWSPSGCGDVALLLERHGVRRTDGQDQAGRARRGRHDRVGRARTPARRGSRAPPPRSTAPAARSRPGLIDCHVHLSFDGGADFAGEAVGLTPGDRRDQGRAQRDPTSGARRHDGPRSGRACTRRSVTWGARSTRASIPGPRILAAGRALTVTGGHGHNLALAREVDGADDVRQAVREEIKGGARAIKVIATGGVLTPGIDATFTAFTPEELEAAVDEAHKWGRGVAAHAIGARGRRGTRSSPAWTPSSTASR